jgi:hypothetical protein
MDIEKLIERLRSHRGALFEMLYKQDMDDAATALSVLQAENEKLRVELEQVRTDCAVAEKNHADCIDELEQVKQERDAAIADWHGFCVKCAWNGEQNLADGQMDDRCRTCKKNGKCNWEWRGKKED